ncbi:antirestriction protein ArdA [Lysobacter silvisoli]|nr:antirestriction protein ArdA [Lysobacter silvisoli]
MTRILLSVRAAGAEDSRHDQKWVEVADADVIRRTIAQSLGGSHQEGAQDWCVLAYEGLPDFGPHPDLDELLAWLDAVDEYGPAFEALWATGAFGRVLQAAEAFADSYQGTYADAASWASHTLALLGHRIDAQTDLDAYARASVAKGRVRLMPAVDGGIHVFWND